MTTREVSAVNDRSTAIENARTHMAATGARLDAARQARDAAQTVRDQLGYVEAGVAARVKLRILEAEATLEEADARLAECVTVHDVAVRMWQTLEAAALRDRQCTRFAQANALAREGQALLDEDRMDRDATSQRCGLQPGGEHPAPVAAQLVAVLGYFRRQLDPPPPPPRPGCIRLRCTARVYDGQAGMGILRRVDDIFDVATEPAEYLREILAQKLAEPIEA